MIKFANFEFQSIRKVSLTVGGTGDHAGHELQTFENSQAGINKALSIKADIGEKVSVKVNGQPIEDFIITEEPEAKKEVKENADVKNEEQTNSDAGSGLTDLDLD